MLEYIRKRAAGSALTNLVAVQGDSISPRLPKAVDLALVARREVQIATAPGGGTHRGCPDCHSGQEGQERREDRSPGRGAPEAEETAEAAEADGHLLGSSRRSDPER